MLPEKKKISFEEFIEMDKTSDEYLEYIDGQIYNQASPSTLHQRISVNFTAEFRNYFKNRQCEILSPSNQSHDLITKMNLYQRFGVKEYWIVNPKLKSIQIYALNDEELYEQVGVYKNNEVAESNIFNDLRINLDDIF